MTPLHRNTPSVKTQFIMEETLLTDFEAEVMKEEISNLKEELSRLQHQINQQAEENSQAKVPSKGPPSSASAPDSNKPSP